MTSRPASSVAFDVAGFWALWTPLRVRRQQWYLRSYTGTNVELTMSRFGELGVPRSTAFRHLATFRAVTGHRWPDTLDLDGLVAVLRARQQGVLPLEATE